MRLAPLALVALPILFNLWVLRAERLPVQHLNDTSVHSAMVRWAEARIRGGHLPLDGWFPRLNLGVPQFHQYQSLPHVLTGLVAIVFGAANSVQWTLYLGLSLWPLSVYWGARLLGLDRWTAACAALVSPLVVSAPGYGFEHSSYVWRGFGIWPQLWAMWLLPLALGLSWRAVRQGKGYALGALALGLTLACHFLTGYVGLLALGLWVLIKPSELWARLWRAALVGIGAILTIGWVVAPVLVDSKWAVTLSAFSHGFWLDSFGAGKVLGWLFGGELFDFGRLPVLSLLVAVGVGVCVAQSRRDERSRALLGFFGLNLLLFFGRPTLGPLTNLLPWSGELQLHRFIIGVQLGGIFLAGVGIAWLGRSLLGAMSRSGLEARRAAVGLALPCLLILGLLPGWLQIGRYDTQGGTWIHDQRAADRTEGVDLQRLIDHAEAIGGGRVYAGMANNWGHTHRVYAVPAYAELLDRDVDAIGFTLRTTSLSSDVEVYFDDTNVDQYDLFNVRYLILPADRRAPAGATFIATAGRHRLYAVPTTGYLEVVDTVWPPVAANRRDMNEQPAAVLRSGLLPQRRFPTVAFAGDEAAPPSLPAGSVSNGPAGQVLVQYDFADTGVFGGQVRANRTAVVLLKASYHPRWTVTVDGKPARTEMVAPSLVGVQVPPGLHRVEFRYAPYPDYVPLLAIGALTLAALHLGPRGWRASRKRTPRGPRLARGPVPLGWRPPDETLG